MTRRSFVGAGVLFFVLLVPRPGHADPIIILDGLITKAGGFGAASIQFSGTEDFSFTGFITPFANFAQTATYVGSTVYPDRRFNSVVLPAAQMFLEWSRWGQRASTPVAVWQADRCIWSFRGVAVVPPVVESLGLVSAPFSLTGQWGFPFIPGQEPRPALGLSGSGIVTAFLAPSFIQ